ncbi:hypothetical protein SAMD00019534_088690 [Acytostelium subglobosum LB1]|uniref:hypothetical protein n=1 Tax=Acytostelium subglobosum LB1 TaxID=1410327 RepID=UPI00064484E2|nr:hypothetical protein SAMD00019534_088690 [Acytostelium subglobosum LB1]GAM25694.1 hypothetical protein SAMD00019534_088690 [Acytostelium subglobosum LB1]|eukprot:XP_012751212.1 hypothetical protein SAMD00019534_088690 [Acytostelium subglobosum LB1]
MEIHNRSKYVFLTGGSGFVGQYIIRELVANGYRVKALSRSAESDKTITAAGGTPTRCSMLDEAQLEQATEGCVMVIHCAAKLETNASSVQDLYKDNITATQLIYNASRTNKVESFVFISTEGVLMDGKDVIDATEDMPLPPLEQLGWYNESKAKAENYILEQCNQQQQHNMRAMIVRLPLVWGKGDNVLTQLTQMANRLSWFWIGSGNNKLSIVHVRNAAAGIVLAGQKGDNGDIFHLTDGEPVKLRPFFTQRFIKMGVAAWKLHMTLPVWLAWAMVWIMALVWRVFRLKGLPILTKTGVIYCSKSFTINDKKARTKLAYRNVITFAEGMDELRDK